MQKVRTLTDVEIKVIKTNHPKSNIKTPEEGLEEIKDLLDPIVYERLRNAPELKLALREELKKAYNVNLDWVYALYHQYSLLKKIELK
jgi:hypothetical protein